MKYLPICALVFAAACEQTKADPKSLSEDAAVYAVASTVSSGDTSSTYVSLLPAIEALTLDASKAREYAGYSTILASEGKLFISDAETSVITKYSVKDDFSLVQDAEIGFSDIGVAPAFFSHAFVSSTKGYFELDLVNRQVWNPQTAKIVGEAMGPTETQLPLKKGDLEIYGSYDRGVAVVGNNVFQPFYWHKDFYLFSATTSIVVYDAVTDNVVKVLEADCPNFDKVTVTDDNTVYFSNWYYSPGEAYGSPEGSIGMCMRRILPGATELDPTYKVTWRDIAGGREGAAFSYVRDGKGIISIFEHQNLAPDTDRADAPFTANWRFYWFDLATNALTPVPNLGLLGAGYYSFTIDSRVFFLIPEADMSKTTVYEAMEDGTFAKLFEAPGWAYQLIRVR